MKRRLLRMSVRWRSKFPRKPHRLALPLLILLLAASESLWIVLLELDAVNGARSVGVFLALLGTLFALFALSALVVGKLDDQRGALLVIAAGAVMFRLTMLPAGLPAQLSWSEKVEALRADVAGAEVTYERFLLYDHDIWRYLWDGHVAAHGVNPFQFAPNDAKLDSLTGPDDVALTDERSVWNDIRDNVNHPYVPTIYPPLAQFVFRLEHAIAPGSVLVMKSLLTGFDLLAALLPALTLRRLDRRATHVILYAWNPLVIKAFAASGHVDAALVAALAATAYFFARGRRRVAAISFGLAVLAKLTPIVLLPFIVKRTGWRNAALIPAIAIAGYAPFFSAGSNMFTGLLTFAREWQFNAGPYALAEWMIGHFNRDPAIAARAVCGLIIIGVILFLAWHDDGRAASFASYATPALGALVVFSPTVMPWYVIWALPLAIVAHHRVWIYFSALVCSAFQVMVDETERGWVLWLECGAQGDGRSGTISATVGRRGESLGGKVITMNLKTFEVLTNPAASHYDSLLAGDLYDRRLLENVHPPDWVNPTPAGKYNLVVVGAGTAGLVSAAGAAGLGAKPAGALLRTGRLDAVDSVARNSPSMIGFAFNNRLLLGGFAGEPDSSPGALNPFGFTAGESLTQLTLDAHRMQDDQAAELQRFATYRKLFRDAFPEEAAAADAANDVNLLINDQTVLRAMATFLRTVVTRNTPYDRFLSGDNGALTVAQRRGARLFFTPASSGGAGCFSCHSGPMLNKQPNDPDVAGAGQFVDENFFNLGLGDHPIQALNVVARNDPNFRDDGRREITFRDDDAFEFRALTLRQLRDGFFFFHNGSFTRVKDVVRYFNAGAPQDAEAAAASTFTTRFTNPRGPGSPRGLGLSDDQVDDLTDFLENALFDPAFVRFDPNSTTDTFDPNERDLTYSIFRPDLAALGAIDGLMASGLARSNNDALSRRDLGLEFLDVTRQVNIARLGSNSIGGRRQEDVYRIMNNSSSIVDTHLLIVVRGLSDRIRLENASGITSSGDPYLRVFLRDGILLPGQSIVEMLRFRPQSNAPPVSYTLKLLSGQGNP